MKLHAFLTTALVESEWRASCSSRFIPGKIHRYPLERRMPGHHRWSGHDGQEKNFYPFRKPHPVRPIHSSHFTNWAISVCFI